MFDQLHDPNPPAATSHHLAVVAERAAGMRRRRNAAVGGLGAAAVVAVGAVGLAVVDRSDGSDAPLADAQLPVVSELPGTTDASAPTTTALDPSELPPAVPVNPDPDDLPPAVPVNPDPDEVDDPGSSDGDGGGGPSDAPADQSPSTDDPPADDDAAPGADEPSGSSIDVATAAALRGADPLVAVTTGGSGVWFPEIGGAPETVSSSNAQRIDFLDDGTATVEAASGGSLATIRPDGSAGPSLAVGVAHAVGPGGDTVCGLTDGGTELTCTDNDGEELEALRFDRADVAGTDVIWFDADTVLVLGRAADDWTLSTVELAAGEVSTRTFARGTDFGALRWAGRTGGDLVVHDDGTDTVLLGTLPEYDDLDDADAADRSTSLEVLRLDTPARSVWFDGSTEILVDLDGALTVDGTLIDGSYRSARR